MNLIATNALAGAIAHWRKNVRAATLGEIDTSWRSCPLCAEFYASGVCLGCPVSAKTGKACCENTPYPLVEVEWYECFSYAERSDPVPQDLKKLVQDELDFLEGLIP